MKIGTYYAYWEKEWSGVDYFPYIKKVKDLGFDILEIAGGSLAELSDAEALRLKEEAAKQGIMMTCCIGLPKQYNVADTDPAVRRAGIEYMKKLIDKMEVAGIYQVGGIIYAYWPCDYTIPFDKAQTRAIAIESVREIADYAAPKGIKLTLEIVNRFEQFLLNTSAEALAFVNDVDRENVYIMLDSFHMNIEENSFREAILTAGKKLGHFHIGEANRKVPGSGRLPWQEMADALHEIGYDGTVVMEPFVRPGGGVGADIKVWRELIPGLTDEQMDADIKESCAFCNRVFNGK